MRAWPLYLRLQNESAYGDGVATCGVDDQHAVIAAAYFDRLAREVDCRNGLIIGPGGPGEVRALSPHMPGQVFALTAHPPEVEAIRAECGDVLTELGDLHELPYQSEHMGLVYASNVLEHAIAPLAAVMEIRRALRPGGVAYLVMPGFDGEHAGRDPLHLHCLDRRVWNELLRKVGLYTASLLDVPGRVDPSCTYVHYRCVAGEIQEPYHTLMRELMTLRASP